MHRGGGKRKCSLFWLFRVGLGSVIDLWDACLNLHSAPHIQVGNSACILSLFWPSRYDLVTSHVLFVLLDAKGGQCVGDWRHVLTWFAALRNVFVLMRFSPPKDVQALQNPLVSKRVHKRFFCGQMQNSYGPWIMECHKTYFVWRKEWRLWRSTFCFCCF